MENFYAHKIDWLVLLNYCHIYTLLINGLILCKVWVFKQNIFQVFLGHSGARDIEGNELPRLVYVSREKRPGYQHHKKAGAENALVCIDTSIMFHLRSLWFYNAWCLYGFIQVRVSAVLTNAPFILNLDCDHYVNNSKAVREAMCFLMDPEVGRDVCYVQFPQRFDGIDRSDRYANRNTVFFDVSLWQSIIFLCDKIHLIKQVFCRNALPSYKTKKLFFSVVCDQESNSIAFHMFLCQIISL